MSKEKPKKKPRGRPALPATLGKRHAVGLRTTKALYDSLQIAAENSGRSVAQEVESRLENSFRDLRSETLTLALGPTGAGLALVVGEIAKMVSQADHERRILSDESAFDDLVEGINRMLDILRPKGGKPAPQTIPPTGQFVADYITRRLATASDKWGQSILEKFGSDAPRIAERAGKLMGDSQ